MAITFLRIDDRIIHGQVVTRWSYEKDCDGILAVNDAAATNELVKNALKSASSKKVLVYTLDEFKRKVSQAIESDKSYFIITKEPATMKEILLNCGVHIEMDRVNVGPQSARNGTMNVNNNADITSEEVLAYEEMFQAGYEIDFRLVPDAKSVLWSQARIKMLNK